jgi:hypothetical protein
MRARREALGAGVRPWAKVHFRRGEIMPRIARTVMKEPGVYHVIANCPRRVRSRGHGEGPFIHKISTLSRVYFAALGFCLMGNHFHFLVPMHPGESCFGGDPIGTVQDRVTASRS